MSDRIFIYGSLLPGETNHSVLQKTSAAFLATARSPESIYAMYDDGDSPFLVIDKQKGGPVFGELWTIPSEDLKEIDAFESDECERTRIQVVDEKGEKHEAWIYLPSGVRYLKLPRLTVADWKIRK